MEPTLNYAAILVAGLMNMVLGALWYSPVLFGSIWMKAMKLNKSEMKADKYMGARYAVAFLMGLLTVYILAHYVDYMEASTASEGAQTAFWPWLGFMVPLLAGSVLWDGKNFTVFAINAAHYLVAMLMAGVILATWQ